MTQGDTASKDPNLVLNSLSLVNGMPTVCTPVMMCTALHALCYAIMSVDGIEHACR